MLRVGKICNQLVGSQGVSRRAVMHLGACLPLGLSLDRFLAAGNPEGGAKSVILLWLWGGPSQLDSFDPKPHAPSEFRGPFASLPTRIPGIRFSELFPLLAARNHQFSLVRTLHTFSNDHGVAGTVGLTGSQSGAVGLNGQPLSGLIRPSLGSAVARALPGIVGVPPFVVVGGRLHQGKKAIIGEGGGPLGAGFDPLRARAEPGEPVSLPELELVAGLSPDRLVDREALRLGFDPLLRTLEPSGNRLEAHRLRALGLLTSPGARQAFDLAREPDSVRDSYGHTRFGRSCLLARRLVECGARFVQVNWSDHVEAEEDAGDGGWDHHYRNFTIMADRHGPWLDRSLSALLDDLSARGLLESTLVVAVGEFGRSPRINDKAGRDHWEKCYSAVVAGGGTRPGVVLGTSDKTASHPLDHAVTPADLGATVHHALGISSEARVELGIDTGGKVIDPLF